MTIHIRKTNKKYLSFWVISDRPHIQEKYSKKEFLLPLGITQSHWTKALHTSFRTINELVNEKRGITKKKTELDQIEIEHFDVA